MSDSEDGVDFALAIYREEGDWQVQELAHDHVVDVETLARALRRFPGDAGVLGLVADEDFFVVVRVTGPVTRVLVSDITAADDWDLAASAVESLGLPLPEDDDDQVPAGDLDILVDLGLDPLDLAALIDDVDLYPDELLSEVARRLGFGQLFDDAIGLASA